MSGSPNSKEHNEIAGAMFKMKGRPARHQDREVHPQTFYRRVPQFLNVFLGQMSVVGPRPPPNEGRGVHREYDLQRVAVKPGITGWWQVTERNSTGFDGMVRRDLGKYIAKQGVFFDLKIILLTVIEVVSGNGAC